jgi:hypothetical protein
VEVNELLQRYGDVRFEPVGKDEITSFMIVETCRVHVRSDDVALVKGMTFRQIYPLINKVSCNNDG